MAGRARMLTRSLLQRRRRLISSAKFSTCAGMSGRSGGGCPHCAPSPNFAQELLGRYKEWVTLENAADDDHRVSSHDINHGVAAKFRKMVGTDDCIIVAAPDIIDARFELNDIIDVRSSFDHPVHAANDATERKSSVDVAARHLLECLQHPILIETAVLKIDFAAGLHLQLPTLPCRVRFNTYCS